MTQGGDEQQAAPQGKQAVLQGNPRTFSDIRIDKFNGMNTISPKGSFGQPNLLENIVMDRLGGYAASPSPRVSNSFAEAINDVAIVDGSNRALVKTASRSYLIDVRGERTIASYDNSSPMMAPYERGTVMAWDGNTSEKGIIANVIKEDGTLSVTDLISKPNITFTVEESTNYKAGGGGYADVSETVPTGTTVFEDSFDRADGSLGGSWSSSALRIQGGRAGVATNTGEATSIASVALDNSNWHQVSATLTEGASLVFYVAGSDNYSAKFTTGRSVQVMRNGNILGALGVVPGVDPVHVEATYSSDPTGSTLTLTTNNGTGVGPYKMNLGLPQAFGIRAEGSGTVDVFRYSRMRTVVMPGSDSANQTDSRKYEAGTVYGFDPRLTHYIMLYPQDYSYVHQPKLGTTLVPRNSTPDKIRPIILQIPPYPNGIKREYKIVFNNPSNMDYQIYGASLPEVRPHTEYNGTPTDSKKVRSDKGVSVKEGTLITAIPSSRSKISTTAAGYADIRMMYQALNAGVTAKSNEPDWPDAVGSTIVDGTVTWLNRGIYFDGARFLHFSEYISRVSSPPVDYMLPEVEWNPLSNDLGEWAQLRVEGTPGGRVEIYRSKSPHQYPFSPHSFFPAGKLTELHQSMTWVVADGVWRSMSGNDTSPNIMDMERAQWEWTSARRTVYYSEPDMPWKFLERFINVPLTKSREIVAIRSVGDYLVLLGDADAAVIAGNSEANFYVRQMDIPGGISQATTAVYQGVLYYRGIGAVYRMNGGKVDEISKPIANMIPDRPQIDTESIIIDEENSRMLFRYANDRILCYDIASDAWTLLDLAMELCAIGSKAYLRSGPVIYTLDGKPTLDGTIRYEGIDGSNPQYRKQLRSVSLVVQAEGGAASISVATQAHRVNAPSSGFSAHLGHLVNQSTYFAQFRTPDRAGFAFDVEIKFNPNNANFIVKPGISLEIYDEAVIRKGY